jgi:hypothetical protein
MASTPSFLINQFMMGGRLYSETVVVALALAARVVFIFFFFGKIH